MGSGLSIFGLGPPSWYVSRMRNLIESLLKSIFTELSTSTMEYALKPLGEHLSCDLCRDALRDRIRDLVVWWSVARVSIVWLPMSLTHLPNKFLLREPFNIIAIAASAITLHHGSAIVEHTHALLIQICLYTRTKDLYFILVAVEYQSYNIVTIVQL